jgi:hypothetical protein
MPFDQFDEYDRWRDHFNRDDIQTRILEVSADVLDRMHENDTRIGPRGETLEGVQWLDTEKLSSPLIHPQGWLARFELLNAKIYGHGCLMLVKDLVREGTVTLENGTTMTHGKFWEKEVNFLRKGATRTRIKQLANRAWGQVDMNLGEFAALGDGGPDTGAAQSHAKLMRMARLGLALVTPYETKSGGYNIVAGPVATTFYEQIYLALSEHFEPMIPARFQKRK